MKIDKRFIPHFAVGVGILVFVVLFSVIFTNTNKASRDIVIKEDELLVAEEETDHMLYEHSQKQKHQEMNLQDILTKATKRIVISDEK